MEMTTHNAVTAASNGSQDAPWIALARVRGLGPATFKKLADFFGDPTRALSASADALAVVPGLDRPVAEALLRFSEWDEVRKDIERSAAAGATIVPYISPLYPARLKAIADPPPFLYVKGELSARDERAVAIVGTRAASDYGLGVTRDLARGLAALGFTIVSGMARGIDGAAHEAALEAGGRTIAVLGSGVDVIYPREHEKLYHRIAEQGAVVSELPLGSAPLAYNFPARNRIISGLVMGVVVVEATEKSGSLITAAQALEQGREVFAVPGAAGAGRSRGPHRLIRQGAKLVEAVEDIVEEIAPQLAVGSANAAKREAPTLPADLSAEAKKIFALVADAPRHIDEIIEQSGITAGKVSEALLDLEIRGLLKQLPGKKFQLK
jgi:DNA processing protein